MFRSIGRTVTRHPLAVVIAWALIAVVAMSAILQGWGKGGLFDRLSTGDVATPHTESSLVADLTGPSADEGERISIVVRGVDMSANPAALASAVAAARPQLEGVDGVASVTDAFSVADPRSPEAKAMLSARGDGFAEVVTLAPGLSDTDVDAATQRVTDAAGGPYLEALRAAAPEAAVDAVSAELIGDSIGEVVRNDLASGESVSLPIALVLLVLVFGGLLAAGLPLAGAIVAIITGMGALWGMTFALEVHSFILNVISLIGLSLSIDYGLLVVSRYREEVAIAIAAREYEDGDYIGMPTGEDMRSLVRDCVTRTVATAGRTVSFSALTIACSIAGLLVMRSPMLRTIAGGAVAVALLAVACAITLVPAIITLLGGHLVRPSLLSRVPGARRALAAVGDASADHGFFSRLSHRVVAHPWLVILAIVAILAAMAAPIGSMRMRTNVAEYIPQGSSVRTAYDTLQADYPALATPTISVVARTDAEGVAPLVNGIAQMEDVSSARASALEGHDDMVLIRVLMDVEDPVGPRVTDAVEQIRATPVGYERWVGGTAARQIDFIDSMAERAPWAIAIVVLAVFVLLLGMTGSLVVPLKALIINTFSLIASLGATSWLFEHGYLGLPKTPGMQTFIVACLVAFGFGLAMDYEVFLLARICEYWEAGHDNDDAVARGLQRSGRIITSAAAIIIAVFLGFVSGDMISIKEIGVGLAIMVAADATLVRLLLVPATMTVLGRWNWWAPAPVRRVYERLRQRA
mgnify:FL=1